MTEQRNLFLAIILMLVVVFGWQYLVGVPRLQQEEARQAEIAKKQNDALKAPAAPTAARAVPRAEAIAQASARAGIATPTLQGSINLTGGRFDDLRLAQYHETTDPTSPTIELLSPATADHPYLAEFGWIPAQGEMQSAPGADTQWQLVQGDTLAPGKDIELAYDNGSGLTFTRHISVDNRYMFTIVDSVDNHGTAPVTLSPYGLVMRRNVPTATRYWVVHEGFVGAFKDAAEYRTYAELGDKNDTRRYDSRGGWLGITDKYWMAAAVPPQSEQFSAEFKAYDINNVKAYQSDFLLNPKIVAPNGSQTVIHHLFAGAKMVSIVDDYRKSLGINKFDMAGDWRWVNPLTKWMFLALDYIYRYVGNYGVAILIFTVLVKLLFFPLANTSYRAMSKMKKLQPEMERLRERFKDDKVQQQQAMMKLYSTEKVNPLAGCVPMLIQIPVFFSLYKVLLVSIDMRQAPFFGWIKDLAAPDPTSLFNLFGLIPFTPPTFLMLGVFPILMGITMWLQTSLNPPPADPVQQRIFSFMPIIFTFMLANFPVGLVIYWAWNNLLSIAQQMIIMKSTGTPIDVFDRLRGMGARLKRGEPAEKPAGPPD